MSDSQATIKNLPCRSLRNHVNCTKCMGTWTNWRYNEAVFSSFAAMGPCFPLVFAAWIENDYFMIMTSLPQLTSGSLFLMMHCIDCCIGLFMKSCRDEKDDNIWCWPHWSTTIFWAAKMDVWAPFLAVHTYAHRVLLKYIIFDCTSIGTGETTTFMYKNWPSPPPLTLSSPSALIILRLTIWKIHRCAKE